jgi:hypothetical protein
MVKGHKRSVIDGVAAVIVSCFMCGISFAANEIEITYRATGRANIVEYVDDGDNVFIFRPSSWSSVSTWSVQVRAVSPGSRTTTDVGLIHVSGADGNNITLYVQNDLNGNGVDRYALRHCDGIRLNTDSNL